MNIFLKIVKSFFFTFLLLFNSSVSIAQSSIGFETNYSINFLQKSQSNYFSETSERSLGFGIPAEIKITKVVSLLTGLYYIPKNYSLKRTGIYSAINQEYHNRYIQIPLSGCVNLDTRKMRISFSAGGYLAYWASATVSGQILNLFNNQSIVTSDGRTINYVNLEAYREVYSFDRYKDNRIEWGANIGTSLAYKIKQKALVYFQTWYSHSLVDQQKRYMANQEERLNRTFSFSFGVKTPL